MDFAALIAQFGLVAVFLGAVFEGEMVLLLAGYAAHRGYLDFMAVVAVAVLGAVIGDQFWFWLGRRHAGGLMARWPRLDARVRRALGFIERHPRWSIFAMRFLWGLRIAMPVALGMSRVSGSLFFALNVLSALVWAPVIATLGYVFGAVLTTYLASLHRIEVVLAALAAIVLLVWRARRRRGQT